MAWPTAAKTLRMKASDWARVYGALLGAADAADRDARVLSRDGTRRLAAGCRKRAAGLRALARKLGHGGEAAAHLGVRHGGPGRRPDPRLDPRRQYLDAYQAAALIRAGYRARPGAWPGDEDADAAAELFVRRCADRMDRPDRHALRAFLVETLRWSPKGQPAPGVAS